MRTLALGRIPDVPGLAAGVVAGVALASVPRGASPAWLMVGGLLGAWSACWTPGLPAAARRPLRGRSDPVERVAAFLPLLCLIPLFRLTVAPGADMAMHVALARALWAGAPELSPAWPGVAPLAYPRGFSGLVALLWGLGPARAGLLASGLTYVLYALGARRLFAALGMRRPATLAALALLLAKAPQDVFAWGGNPTVLALALALHAAAIVAAASPPDWPRAAISAGLLLSGAAAVHPMGALIGALVVLVMTVRGRNWRAGLVAFGLLGGMLALLAIGGPALSDAEWAWIVDWGRTREAVLRGEPWRFPLRIWLAFPRVLGIPWTAVIALAAAWSLVTPNGRRLAGRIALLVLAIGALLAAIPAIPWLGGLLYPIRLVPLLALATAPLIDASLARVRPVVALGVAGLLIALALPFHARWYQRVSPMATEADLRVLACAAARVPEAAVIAGAYGDATQWVPALTGRRITLPHRHVSLLDETWPALEALRPTYRLTGERRRYPPAFPGPDPGPEPTGPPLCQAGAARLWRLDS